METIISIKNVCKSFGNLDVLKGIDYEVHKGEVISIIGASGSGKSTLLRCLNLLETPTSGEISFEGDILFKSDTAPLKALLKEYTKDKDAKTLKADEHYLELKKKIAASMKSDRIQKKTIDKNLNIHRQKWEWYSSILMYSLI